jgi:hypothetical protein
MDYTLTDRDAARFARKHSIDGVTGCWVWQGTVFQKTKYSLFNVKYTDGKWRPTVGHRVSYELHKGPIPATFDIDHLCRNRQCVNPAHLEAVPRQKNFLRGAHVTAICVSMNRCPRGHEFTEENTFVRKSGKRECRTCMRNRDKLRNRNGGRREHYARMYQQRKQRAAEGG